MPTNKLIASTLLLMLVSLTLFSQNESFFGLTLGAALPQGSYADTDFGSEESAYAKTGFLFTFDGALFPDDYLGFGATVTYGSNNPDKEKFKADLVNDILTRYPELEQYEDAIYFDLGVWRYLNFHVGPNITFNAGNFNFDIRALAGLSLGWAPDQLLQITENEEIIFSRQMNEKAVPAIGFTLGTGVRYALNSGYVFRLIAEYAGCKPNFEFSENVIESLQSGQEIGTKEVAIPINNLQFGIGIAYNFEL